MTWLTSPDRHLLGTMTIGLLLMTSGAAKSSSPHYLPSVILSYRLFPESISRLVGRWLPVIEVVIGALVCIRLWFPWTAIAAALLLLIFSVVLTLKLIRGESYLPCGCFSELYAHRISWAAVARNLALSLLALVAASSTSSTTLDQRALTRPSGETVQLFLTSSGLVCLILIGEILASVREKTRTLLKEIDAYRA